MRSTEATGCEVSVLIRVRNEAQSLSRVLEQLAAQQLDVPWEVVVLDNESDDGSAAVAAAAGARVFVLPRELFGYGRAINVGVNLCRGRHIVLLSAHAWPRGADWLARMVEVLRDDPNVGAAFSRHVPPGGLSRQELRRYEVFGAVDRRTTPGDLHDGLERGADVYELGFFSNAASAFPREMAEAAPFRDLPTAEDRAFALECLLQGREVAYVADATVVYERRETLRTMYRAGRRGQIAKHLVREVGIGGRSAPGRLGARVARRVASDINAIGRCLAAPIREPRTAGRALRYTWISAGTQAGILVGSATWRRHRRLRGLDATRLAQAKRAVRPYVPEAAAHRIPMERWVALRQEAGEPQMP